MEDVLKKIENNIEEMIEISREIIILKMAQKVITNFIKIISL